MAGGGRMGGGVIEVLLLSLVLGVVVTIEFNQQEDSLEFIYARIIDATTFENQIEKLLFEQIAANNFTLGIEESSSDARSLSREPRSCMGIVPEIERRQKRQAYSDYPPPPQNFYGPQSYNPPYSEYPPPPEDFYGKQTYDPPVLNQTKEDIVVFNGLRPFPSGTFLTFMVSLTVPFIPFGIFDFRLPIAFYANYIVERFNNRYAYDEEFNTSERRSFGEDQVDLYEWLGSTLSNTLAVDGRNCVKRLICEIAHTPVRDRSFMGHVLTEIMAPRTGSVKTGDEFVAAERTGHEQGDCKVQYGQCPFSVKSLME